jgi:hypothetical protein
LQRGTLIDKRREFNLFESGGGRNGVEGSRSVFEGKTTLRDLEKRVLGSQFVSTRKTTRNHFQLCCLDPWGNRFFRSPDIALYMQLAGHYSVQIISGDRCLWSLVWMFLIFFQVRVKDSPHHVGKWKESWEGVSNQSKITFNCPTSEFYRRNAWILNVSCGKDRWTWFPPSNLRVSDHLKPFAPVP